MENYERLEKVGEGAPFPLPLPPFHEDLVALLITVPPPFSPTGTYGTVYKCRQVSTVLRLPCRVKPIRRNANTAALAAVPRALSSITLTRY